jgi:hypothetical protein
VPKRAATVQEMQAVLGLPGAQRYEHFVKQVADWEEAWGLFQNGWALAARDDNETRVFPLWPSKEYAEACAKGIWEGFEPKSIALDDLLNVLLPKLRRDETLVGVFYTPEGKGVTRQPADLAGDLGRESAEYE